MDLGEGDVVAQLVLHVQHLYVGSQSHLASAVAVEVKLVLLEVLKMLVHCQELLQSLHAKTPSFDSLETH